MTPFVQWMVQVQARVETALDRLMPGPGVAPLQLHRAMRYAVLGGGKRVRPLLVFAAGELVRATPARLDHLACAVECIHAYSLAHDDLPCMDDDVLRRGKPAVHVEFGQASALLAGDALQSFAFALLSEELLADDPKTQIDMVRILALACGSRGMAGGQAMDLSSVGRRLELPELEMMHIHKTGALIRASVALGARCAPGRDSGAHIPLAAFDLECLDHFSKCVGLAFQVVDDVLDAEASTATLGKTAGKDSAANKPTYVSLLGVARSKALAEELRAEAHAALARLGAPAAERAGRLVELADFIVLRKF